MATFYIATNGVNDSARDGSVGQEWATLSYACSRVTTFGDVIHVNAGSYNETAQCTLAPGVSIEGSGRTTTTITATSTLTNLVYGSSSAGTDGRQSISNITFNCNLNVTYGIRIVGRSNVKVVDCGIQNALDFGLIFADTSGRGSATEPTLWAKNNIIRGNYLVNCGRDYWHNNSYWAAYSAIEISGQEDMLIYNNDIDNQTGGRHAYGIKGLHFGGYFKGLKIYNNKIRTNIRDVAGEQSFGFNIELWTGVGGVEVFSNDCNGCIDIAGYGWWDDYNYGYAVKVYDNMIIQADRPTNQPEAGIILEGGAKDGCYFYNNWVENFSTGFQLGNTSASLVSGYDGVWIYYNIISGIGYTSGGVGTGFAGYSHSGSFTNRNIYILNNTIHKVNSTSGWGINIEYSNTNTWVNINIKNNIIYNAYTPIQFRNQTITSMYIHNNLTYGATRTIGQTESWANSNISTRQILNNQENVNPLFVTSEIRYTLSSNSPCINAGVNVGLTEDYHHRPIVGLPDIGSTEYISDTIYYVSTIGSDESTRNGGVGQEWGTLSYACSRVTSPNSLIFVNAGVYNEGTNQIVKAPGVSILGSGVLSHIVTNRTHGSSLQATIYCASTAGTTVDDNSSISRLRITGNNLTAHRAIYIGYRNNVKVHHCIIEDFYVGGIFAFVSDSYPTLYISGIEIRDNILNNCATLVGADLVTVTNNGCIRIRGTSGTIIRNNIIDVTFKPHGLNGHCVSTTRCKKLKTYNNVFRMLDHEVDENGVRRWNFFWEEWDYKGDNEFYNNRLYGLAKFSLGGEYNDIESDCTYGYKVYENKFLNTINNYKTINGAQMATYAICIEGDNHRKVDVYKNLIQRYEYGIEISTPTSGEGYWHHYWQMDDIRIFNNIIENVGCLDSSWGTGIWLINETDLSPYYGTYNNIQIFNNVVTPVNITDHLTRYGITCNINGFYNNLLIANNIVSGFRTYPIWVAEHAEDGLNINGLQVIHNCFYGSTNNVVYLEDNARITATNVDVTTGNIASNPLFTSTTDYHLQVTSPCINAGYSYGITFKDDYEGNVVYAGSAPDIGAYETNSNNVYYLSPSGSDQFGTGTEGNPWFTIERAWSELVAGDIIYMRGGTYYYNKTQNLRAVSGTSDNYTRLWNYPGERPIIRPAVGWVYDGWYYGIYFQNLSSIYVLGLDVCYFTYQQTSCCRGIMAQNVNNSIFENLACYRNELGMMVTGNSGGNYIINCDFYENYDPYSNPPYNNGDGLDVSTIPQGYNNAINFCRAWYNADDGFDFFNNEGIITMNGCWTWMNGYQEDHESFNQPPMIGNDGNGFKLGQAQNAVSTTRRYLYNCIAALNRVNNFSQNTLDPQILTCELYNCLSYGSVQRGYQFNWGAEGSTNSILRNNIAYLNNAHLSNWIINDHNTWNTGFSVSSSDFVSLDDTQLIAPRNIDGSLPYITFGRLSSNSPLIDAGVDIGRPYYGIAPDIGAFEAAPLYGAVAENIHVSRVGII